MDNIQLWRIVAFAFPEPVHAPLCSAPSLCSQPVINLLRYAGEVTLQAAWHQTTSPVNAGWLTAASATYQEAAAHAEHEMEDPGEYCPPENVWHIIAAADSLSALGGWGHLQALPLLGHLRPASRDHADLLRQAADAIDASTAKAHADQILEAGKFRPCRDASQQLRDIADGKECW